MFPCKDRPPYNNIILYFGHIVKRHACQASTRSQNKTYAACLAIGFKKVYNFKFNNVKEDT